MAKPYKAPRVGKPKSFKTEAAWEKDPRELALQGQIKYIREVAGPAMDEEIANQIFKDASHENP